MGCAALGVKGRGTVEDDAALLEGEQTPQGWLICRRRQTAQPSCHESGTDGILHCPGPLLVVLVVGVLGSNLVEFLDDGDFILNRLLNLGDELGV